ncbi:MAG: hypothetical protein WBB82_03660 [Limnothrix sp.]
MTMREKTTNRTLRAMQRVWARNVLKQHALEQGNCNCQECRDAKATLGSY